jgi:DNA-binding CsgD family transcriptional regulator
MSLRMSDYQEVGRSATAAALQANLVRCAQEMDFGLVSAVLMKGDYSSSDVVVRSVSNTPAAFIEISQSLDEARSDPVMQRLMSSAVPFAYDQKLYAEAGAAPTWETQAPFGYCTGIAVGLHLPERRHFLLGVDRPKRLPRSELQLTRMLADLQLLAVHAQFAAQQIFDSSLDEEPELPHLTPRELECLRWTMEGKSAYVTGRILSISASAVNFHLQNSMRKLGVSSKHSAVLRCVALGLL